MSIFGSGDLVLKELANAYYTNVKSVRVPLSPFGPLWEEAQINAQEFCASHPLIAWPDGFSIENEIPQRRRWMVFFSLADAYARWPSLRPAPKPPAPAKSNDIDAATERENWPRFSMRRHGEKARGFLRALKEECTEVEAWRALEDHLNVKITRDVFRGAEFDWPKRKPGERKSRKAAEPH
jgi:hypothetical protein